MQAWQYETPVISLYIDPDNVIRNNGLGICSKTFEKLCSAVSMFMEDQELLSLTAQKCVRYVEKNHSVETIMHKYINMLNY